VTPNIAVGYLLGFLFKMALACGLLFQLPLVVAVLTRVGLVTPGFLIRKWRHAVLIIFVVSAVVTPGDGPSQIVLATPVVVLYFASIAVSRAIVGRRRPVPAPEAEAGAGPASDPADGRDHGEE
jgi:sec-independent protein translocase protein TatC